jgi:transcriptional regulator with XRE-family HTH domain
MPQRIQLLEQLKRSLKERGLTYSEVAKKLGLSLASVKRLFASGDLSLERVESICELVGLELSDVVERMQAETAPIKKLSLAQEQEIVADPKLFLITWLVLNRMQIDEIVKLYDYTHREARSHLIRLDRLKIIELQPGNRARLKVNSNLSWQPGGPMWRYVHQNLLKEFFASDFQDPHAEFRFYGAIMSEATLQQIKRTIQNALRECAELADRDRTLPLDKRTGAAYVFALRPWQYTGFNQFRRPKGG